MEGGVSHSSSAVVNPFSGVSGQTANRMTNRKLKMVIEASTNMRAWIMSCPALG